MRRSSRPRAAATSAVAVALAGLFFAPPARAGAEVQVASGPDVQGSSWRGDAAIAQSLKLGVRFKEVIAIDALTRLGYATVDQRVLTYLSLGVSVYGKLAGGRLRPFGRLSLVHQHEEPMSAYRHDPFGAIFGVGDGIRHRGGFGGSLGTDFVIARGAATAFLLGVDVNSTWFPDPRGPAVYFGGGLWAGLDYSL
ncbi:MAG: hypothetical protein KF764_03785 [Labilithrix sp.]|nr:hypothetical protein [Labilithrix sp.]MBX3222218.1 hypothetical protein [Labilithrix sp.]